MTPSESLCAILRDVLDELAAEGVDAGPDDPALTVCRRWSGASAAPACSGLGPASIWALADQAAQPDPQGDLFGDPAPAPAVVPSQPHRKMTDKVRRVGVRVVVQGLAYPSGRWTDERAEAERIRRAKQIVPKPVAAARVFRVGKGA